MAVTGDSITKRVTQMVHVVKANAKDDFMTRFAELKTDPERIAFVWKEEGFQGVSEMEPEYCAKSTTDACQSRKKGNSYFQKKAYISAISEYSKSIIKAPVCQNSNVEENELALSYANRSAALFHLSRYEPCLTDIQQAFSEGYPKDLAYKLLDRRGKCYLQLGRKRDAIESFTKAQSSLSDANLEIKYLAIWQKNLKNQLENCNVVDGSKHVMSASENNIPRITGGANPSYLHASSAVDFQFEEQKGRHARAATDIRLGDVVLVEKPYTTVTLPDFYLTHCYDCAERVTLSYPCPTCSSIVFCSLKCKDRAVEKYHQYECQFLPVFDQEINGKIGHLTVRLIMQQGIKHVLDLAKSWSPAVHQEHRIKSGETEKDLLPADFSDIYLSDTGCHERSSTNLLHMSVLSCFLMKILKVTGFITQNDFDGVLAPLGSVILRLLKVVQCNALRIIEVQKPSSFDDCKPTPVGVAMYPTAAMFNHSCDPLVHLSFYGNKLVMRALRNISTGEEIVCSYGPVFYDSKRTKRLAGLNENYFFTCKCVACREDWPCWQELQNLEPAWLCEACGRKLICDALEEKRFAKCKSCSHRQNLEEALNKLGISHDAYSKCMAEALSGHVENALPGLVDHMLLLQTYMMQPWRDYTACQVALRQSFLLLANKKC